MAKHSPGRGGLKMTLAPLTPEEALRRAMQVKPPSHDPPPPKQPATKAKSPRKKPTGK